MRHWRGGWPTHVDGPQAMPHKIQPKSYGREEYILDNDTYILGPTQQLV